MLNAKSNRLNYAQLLAPPEGYELARAIGTTYSLDLYALLAMPVAMFYADSLDGDFKQDRYDVLEALRQCSQKVTIYCQADKLKVPANYRSLFAFIDGCVELVQPPILRSSFHPKLWVLRFESPDDKSLYRLTVLSRNLTFDQSWDMAIYTEGVVRKQNSEAKKLSAFLQQFASEASIEKDARFYKDLEKVDFAIPDGFDRLELAPILGFDNKIEKFPNPLSQKSLDRLLAISPFIDNGTIKQFKEQSNQLVLLSRLEELQKMKQSLLKETTAFRAYYMNTGMVEGASWQDTEGEEPATHNLHAKLFVGEQDNETQWYLGSANFTDPAFTRNAEMMLGLRSDSTRTSFDKVLEGLTNEEQRFFIPYEPLDAAVEDKDKEAKENMRALLYELGQLNIRGTLIKSENEKCDVQLEVDLQHIVNTTVQLYIRPIHRGKEGNIALKIKVVNTLLFDNIATANLSPFFICTVQLGDLEEELLVKTELEMPEEREDIIFKSLIGNKVRFLEYLQFVLAPTKINNAFGYLGYEGSPERTNQMSLASLLGMHNNIYEALLLTASRQPKKLEQIDAIIKSLQKIDPEIVADFMPIWEVYQEFINE